MGRTPWIDSDDPDKVSVAIGWRAVAWILATLLVVALISGGIWLAKVALSDVKGRGDAQRIKNDAPNRIAAQEGFEARYADIKATDAKLDAAAQAVTEDPTDRTAHQTLTGLRSYCQSVVGEYNAKARSFTAADFRAADLPFQIDPTDPATDCKPNEVTR